MKECIQVPLALSGLEGRARRGRMSLVTDGALMQVTAGIVWTLSPAVEGVARQFFLFGRLVEKARFAFCHKWSFVAAGEVDFEKLWDKGSPSEVILKL